MQNIIAILNGIFIGSGSGGGAGLFPGILDAYPDAAAAYSLRRLSNDWAKPANTDFTFGNALEFDGLNDYVSTPSLTITTSSTLSFWANDNGVTGMYFGNNVNDDSFYKNALNKLQVGISGSFFNFTFTNPTVLGEWSHYMLTKDGSTVRLYVDGVEASNSPHTFIGDSTINYIGRYRLNNLYLNGKLDEISIWNSTAGTTQNAIDLYNGGLGALASSVIPSPTAYWKMNESGGATTAIDSSGNGNNGTLVDFPPFAWQAGGGLDFDGVNDYIEFSTISLSNTSSYTISFWFKFNGSGGSFTGKPGSSMYTGTNPAGTTLYWRPSGAFYQYAIDPSVTLTNGKWSHIMFTQTANSTGDVYVDGVISTSSSTQLNVGNLSIDYIGSGANGYMNGEFGEVAIWNGTAGTGQNALDIYELGTTGDASTIISSPNRYYKLNETAGTVAADSGSDGANGTLFNFNTTSSWVVGNANKGVLVEIRRSSDNAVKAFYYDDNNELSLASEDAAGTTLSSWIGSDNGFVRTWYDQSGNANNATQTTTTTQPSIITAGVISTEQGKPAIKLIDNSLDFFTITEKDFNDLTWLTVLKQESTTPNNTNAVVFYSSGSFYGGSNVDNQGNPMLSKLLIKTSINNTSAGGGEKVQHLNYYHRTGRTTDGGLNGQVNTPAVTNSTTFPVNRLFFYSANAYYFEGTAQEIIMYDSSKSADRAGIETNINNFYRIYGGAAFSFGNALKFDGANDFVSPNTNLSNENDVSLSCWINAETPSHGYNVLLANSSGSQYFAIRIIAESNLIKFEGFGIFNSLNTNNTFIENTWFHIGVIQSGNSVSYYYNGVLQGTGVGNSSKRSDIDLIGKYGGTAGGGLKLNGLLDEYVWWDSALTDTQMKNQYNLGAGNFADLDVTPLVYYSCNQVDGTTPLVNDGSGGSSYDGTLNNFATPYFVPHTPAVDADAAAFISAAAITGATQKSALNQLVLDLKGTGSTTNNSDLWTSKLHAFYPTSPIDDTTASLTACSYNLRDVSLYQITWYNSPTVSIQGVTGNGSSMYGDTGYNPSIKATLNDSHMTIYKDTGWDTTTNFWGCRDGGSSVFEHTYDAGEAWSAFYATSTSGRVKATMGNTNVDKFRIICSRVSSSSNVVYENGALIGSISTTAGTLPNRDYFVLYSDGLNWDSSTMQCSSIGLGLTANEAKDLDDAIQKYNTALER